MATFSNQQFGSVQTNPTFGDLNYAWADANGEWNNIEDTWENEPVGGATFINVPRSDKSIYGTAVFGVSRYGRDGTSWNNQNQEITI